MIQTVVLPGIGGSGEIHWQSGWEAEDPSFVRFVPTDWDHPDLADWQAALDTALVRMGAPVILLAHSLACLLVAHAAPRIAGQVLGAFLVAVPDPESPVFPVEAATFRAVPRRALPFPALIVASSDDPYGSTEHARRCARDWNAGIVVVGPRGHINGASDLGRWDEGRGLFDAFRAGLRA